MQLQDWLARQNTGDGLTDTILKMAASSTAISTKIRELALSGSGAAASGITNVQGETQLALDDICNEICLQNLKSVPQIAFLVSEEIDHVEVNEIAAKDATLAVCFDPLDGSSNVACNAAIGTIFSVLDCRESTGSPEQKVLGSTKRQLAAIYALYGPATLLVVTTGNSVAKFALNEVDRTFALVEDHIKIPKAAAEFAINMSYESFWSDGVRNYVKQCVAGKQGPRDKVFNMRWAGAMVADVHRVFCKGGHFIYPALPHKGEPDGKLRFLYEGLPMAMLVETAGGEAFAGMQRLVDFVPTSIHQRTPVSLGSSEEVQTLLALSS